MNSRKLAQLAPVAASDIRSLAPARRPSFDSISSLAPLLEEMTERMGGGVVITSGGADIFRTIGYDPKMMIAEDGVIELELGGRTAYLRFLRQTTAACPALSRMILLGQLSAGMAHDINNMLSVIQGNLGILEHERCLCGAENAGGSARDIFGEISDAVNNIAALCRRIQSLGSLKSEVSAIRVSDAAADSLALLRFTLISAKERGLEVAVDNRIPEDIWCMAVSAELQSCMLNILKNAVEHGFRGKDSGVILLDACKEEGLVRLDISNDGHMISPAVSESLLRRPLASECNNGIGLFSAAERLRSFGSWLTFSSEPGMTTFSITLIEAYARH